MSTPKRPYTSDISCTFVLRDCSGGTINKFHSSASSWIKSKFLALFLYT